MQERHIDREKYFTEQSTTCRKYYIPYIKEYMEHIPDKILEVGCGEGGNLLPFAELGCEVTGVDIAKSRIEQAKLCFSERGCNGSFINSDIFKLKEFEGHFSLIIIHDVIEHIEKKEDFLNKIEPYLSKDGAIFIAFPAWQMPFGGHQQIAHRKITSHCPFLHLLPRKLYKCALSLCKEEDGTINELLEIHDTKCSIERFYSVIKKTKFKVRSRCLYFINPHYEVKFGLKPVKLNKLISGIPYIRNFFSTSCFFILSR